MNKSITKTQWQAIQKMKDGKQHCAYDVGCGLNTLEALERKGIVEKKTKFGYLFFPRINIQYKLKQQYLDIKLGETLIIIPGK